MTNFAEMGKEALRTEMRAAGLSYAKLNNDGMRAALEAHRFAQPAVMRSVDDERAAYVEMAKKMDTALLGIDGVEGHCPCCGIDLSNGVWTQDDANTPEQAKGWVRSIACLGCGGEWGPPARKSGVDRHSGTGLKIEQNREERNGVKRPSAGGKCRQVWDALDANRASTKTLPTVATAKQIATEQGWNVSNAAIEFYQWRKFNGLGK